MDIAHGRKLSHVEIRQRQLSILDRFAEICREEGLTYYAYYGTLLGCARHSGYIPWDDDIDLAVPRAHYDRLSKLDWPGRALLLVTHDLDPRFPFGFAKLCEIDSVVYEAMDEEYTGWGGVNIDLWPIDSIGNVAPLRHINAWMLSVILRLVSVKTGASRSTGTRARRASIFLARLATTPMPMALLLRIADLLAIRRGKRLSRFAGCRFGAYGGRDCFPRDLFESVATAEFEGRQLPVPEGWRTILSGLYGDFMTPPPQVSRESSHSYVAFATGDSGSEVAGSEH